MHLPIITSFNYTRGLAHLGSQWGSRTSPPLPFPARSTQPEISPSLYPMALKPGSNKGLVLSLIPSLLPPGTGTKGSRRSSSLALLSSSEQHWSWELVPHPPPPISTCIPLG